MLPPILAITLLPLIRAISEANETDLGARPLCPCGHDGKDITSRVVGGINAGWGTFPFASALLHQMPSIERHEDPSPFCGGTLITDVHVVTASHCVRDKSPAHLYVDVGEYDLHESKDGVIIPAHNISLHPEYVPGYFHADIAVIELARPVRFKSGVRTAYLLPAFMELQPGTTVAVYGWGRLGYTSRHPDMLQEVTLPVVQREECQTHFETVIEPGMICAGGEVNRDACIGDSGSGLVVRLNNEYVLCGVVSFGRKCALPHVPGVYTQLSHFTDWILEQTRSSHCKPCVYEEK